MELLPLATGAPSNSDSQTTQNGKIPMQEGRIAQLAYALWQYRGCPIGFVEEDWLEAERQILRPQARAAKTVGVAR
jgi:hypothetical protein